MRPGRTVTVQNVNEFRVRECSPYVNRGVDDALSNPFAEGSFSNPPAICLYFSSGGESAADLATFRDLPSEMR